MALTNRDEAPDPPPEQHPHGGEWLRDIILGLNDGLVTTLVFVMTLGGLVGSRHGLVVTAMAELLAGGLSMAFGGFLATRADSEIRTLRVAVERHEIATEPDEERQELRAIYRRKGFTGHLLDAIISHQTATPERWLAAMLHDEHGMTDENLRSPLVSGVTIGLSFMVGALVPILPFFWSLPRWVGEVLALVLTAAAAMGLGALKARHTLKTAVRSGLEFLVIAGVGAGLGILIGKVVHGSLG